jgi:hypothetical protein
VHLQQRLDETVVPYGTEGIIEELNQKMREKAAAPDSVKIDNSGYYSKRALKREVVTGRGDLLADVRNKAVDLDTIAEKELPKSLQSEPKAKRREWLEGKLKEREVLESKMAAIIAKRDAFVMEERKKSSKSTALDSFDKAVEDTLRVQLE